MGTQSSKDGAVVKVVVGGEGVPAKSSLKKAKVKKEDKKVVVMRDGRTMAPIQYNPYLTSMLANKEAHGILGCWVVTIGSHTTDKGPRKCMLIVNNKHEVVTTDFSGRQTTSTPLETISRVYTQRSRVFLEPVFYLEILDDLRNIITPSAESLSALIKMLSPRVEIHEDSQEIERKYLETNNTLETAIPFSPDGFKIVSVGVDKRFSELGVTFLRSSLEVSSVDDSSICAEAGVTSGCYLAEVDGKLVTSPKQVHDLVLQSPHDTIHFTFSGRIMKPFRGRSNGPPASSLPPMKLLTTPSFKPPRPVEEGKDAMFDPAAPGFEVSVIRAIKEDLKVKLTRIKKKKSPGSSASGSSTSSSSNGSQGKPREKKNTE